VLDFQDEALLEIHSKSYGLRKSWNIGNQWLAND